MTSFKTFILVQRNTLGCYVELRTYPIRIVGYADEPLPLVGSRCSCDIGILVTCACSFGS